MDERTKDELRQGIIGCRNFSYKDCSYSAQKIVNMKDTLTGKWVRAIMYKPWDGDAIYVRELEDFIAKFEVTY